MQIHIGQIVRTELRNQGRSNGWLAGRIGLTPRALQKIFLKPGVDTRQLFKISQAMGVDFFRVYSDSLGNEMKGSYRQPSSQPVLQVHPANQENGEK